jgi:tetratricopeptide (TPR) repeat protein
LQAYAQGRDGDALELFQHAVKLDPDFALAYMGVARVHGGSNDDLGAREYVMKAAALKNRLPARDQLYIDAWLARFGPSGPMLDKWRLLGKLYPDYYAAHYNYAYFSWQLENRAAEAITAIEPALSEHDPQRGSVYYTLGYLLLAENRFAEASRNFATAASLGYTAQGLFRAAGMAAQRHFDEALEVIGKAKSNGIPSDDIFMGLEKIALDADQGSLAAARAAADAPIAQWC